MMRIAALLAFVSIPAWAVDMNGDSAHDPVASLLLWVTVIFLSAIVGRILARCFAQPGVLGELLMGVLLGNLGYYFGSSLFIVLRDGSAVFEVLRELLTGLSLPQAVAHVIPNPKAAQDMLAALSGPDGIHLIKIGYVLDGFSRYGVIFLLFMVGLESSVDDLKKTGLAATKVALIGVVVPIALGYAVSMLLMPNEGFKAALFVAATLCATSIGITARVLTDMQQLHTREAKTILGAATLDDVLGLIILAVVSSIVVTGTVAPMDIVQIVVSAAVFFIAGIAVGPWLVRRGLRWFKGFALWEAKLFVTFIFLMTMAWLATLVQLASIIGAFTAGLVLHDSFFDTEDSKQQRLDIRDVVAPLEAILAPLFFVLIGIQVKLETFLDTQVLIIAAALIAAAILGKLVSGWGAAKGDDKLLIGIGMMPRGEVGLVFASIGRTLGVINDALFAAIVLMIMVTTFLAPPLLTWRFQKHAKAQSAQN